jgi:hypothetical protein
MTGIYPLATEVSSSKKCTSNITPALICDADTNDIRRKDLEVVSIVGKGPLQWIIIK